MTYQTLQLEIAHGAATVTLNRPDVRNAFNETVIAELNNVFLELGQDEQVRAIVLAANGPAFCAGADSATSSANAASPMSLMTGCPSRINALLRFRKSTNRKAPVRLLPSASG